MGPQKLTFVTAYNAKQTVEEGGRARLQPRLPRFNR